MIKYPKISELMILKSDKGYYIGRIYKYSEDVYEPYSRESPFYKEEEVAKKDLVNNDFVQINL